MKADPSGARRAVAAAVFALALAHAAIAALTARANFVTVDEAGHIASGVSHHQHGTFASYRVNPPPARWLATWPVVLFQAPPRLEPLADLPGRRPEGAYGAAFATALGPRYPSVVFVARLFNVALSTAGLLLVWALGRRAFGVRAGLLAAAFYAFDPTILAHASVLTSDVAATVGALAFTWGLVRYLRRPRLG
ncbi:MAG TPA: glycosyltransferase family 39 protein, partial [Polyangiaceae bacterium]|nr:glycosyltransferase family 39 protein [Polyangiaceae bacterium]